MHKKTILCIGIIIILAAISSGSIFILKSRRPNGQMACIYQHGEQIQAIDLSAVKKSYDLTIENDNGGYNVITIAPGKIAVTDASCPDKVCVHTGFISDSLMPITCLPNELLIRIETHSDINSNLDGFSH